MSFACVCQRFLLLLFKYNRKVPPSLPSHSDLVKRVKTESSTTPDVDQAIDLSTLSSRSSTPRKNLDGVELSSDRHHYATSSTADVDSDSSEVPKNMKIPRIHIVSESHELPLNLPSVPSPLPPSITPELNQSSYSRRRSRILDAPNIPKKSRSPSPERRYVRTVPRDMIEAARRRGLRARVRTKWSFIKRGCGAAVVFGNNKWIDNRIYKISLFQKEQLKLNS